MAASFTVTKGSAAKGAAKLKEIGGRIRAALPSALARMGPDLVATAKDAMRTAKPDLHPYTVARKGSSVPLVGGVLEASITYRVESTAKGAFVWFGIPASAGRELLTIAKVQEHGITIDVTPKMRGYLAATGLHLAAETTTIIVPARPFIAPALERVRNGTGVRLALTDALRGVAR